MLREELIQHAKNFKTSWVNLGQALYPVWKDKLYYNWNYDKFEYYTEQELGIKQSTALKLLKTYFFLEQEEPAYLAKEFPESREAKYVPQHDAINVLRLARQKKELTRDDYQQLKKAIFDKGRDASAVRKDLTAIMKERKPVDPEEERRKRNTISLRKLLLAMRSFKRDMEAFKMAPAHILEETDMLMKKIEAEIADEE
jgi:hypothetical protein